MMGGRRLAVIALLVQLMLAGCAARPAPAARFSQHPMRVMSMNQCTDQLALALLPPERIVSVSWLARDPTGSVMAKAAGNIAINHALAEEVVRQNPDLILVGAFTNPATRAALDRLGYPMMEVADPQDFEGIRAITRQVARAVDERARGEELIAAMDRRLAQLARERRPLIRVAAWDSAGFAAQPNSLYETVLKTAGAVNVTNAPPFVTTVGRPDVEALLHAAPRLIVRGVGRNEKPGLHDNVDRHPLVRRYWDGGRTIAIPPVYYVCGTPFAAEAAWQLRQQLRAAEVQARKPLPFAQGGR